MYPNIRRASILTNSKSEFIINHLDKLPTGSKYENVFMVINNKKSILPWSFGYHDIKFTKTVTTTKYDDINIMVTIQQEHTRDTNI